MSQEERIPLDFAEWIIRSLDGTITTEQFTMLDHEIASNDAARAYYLEFITTYVGLVDLVGVLPKAAAFVGKNTLRNSDESSELMGTTPHVKRYPGSSEPTNKDTGALHFGPGVSDEDKILQIELYARQQLADFLAQQHTDYRQSEPRSTGWDLSWTLERVSETGKWLLRIGIRLAKTAAVCALVVIVILAVALYVHANRTVATLVDSMDAKWNVKIEKQAKLKPRLMSLEQGYARILLDKGTEVILQAPSTFKVQTSNKMFLESGWMTAKVPPKAMGFTVNTPQSIVVDYGTEFGFLVGADNNAEVHVFDGSVGLASGNNMGAAKHPQRLVKGEVATIDTAGRIDRRTLTDRPHLFMRTMPTGGGFGIPGKRLSLADMVGGGNGLDTGVLGQGINPSTGEVMPAQKVLRGFDNGFVKVPSLLFIDGVFIPDSNDGPVVISSTGIVFEGCPKTLGKCYETINNGAIFRPGSLGPHLGCLAGKTYGTKASPSIGMHPNMGITFDLDKIRSSMPEVEIDRFRALCGISETAIRYAERDWDPNEVKVDFWVLVDGRIRFSRKLAAMPPRSEQIDIPLSPNDHFLTLATTNPGNYLYCWAMLAEPMLELTTKKEATGDGNNKIRRLSEPTI